MRLKTQFSEHRIRIHASVSAEYQERKFWTKLKALMKQFELSLIQSPVQRRTCWLLRMITYEHTSNEQKMVDI